MCLSKASEIAGIEKVAILLILLGKDYASKIFNHFSDEEIEKITFALAGLPFIEPKTKEVIMEEFDQNFQEYNFATFDTASVAQLLRCWMQDR